MESFFSIYSSQDLLIPSLGKFLDQSQIKHLKEQLMTVQLEHFLLKNGYFDFKEICQQINYLLVLCKFQKQEKQVFLTILKTTKEEQENIRQEYQNMNMQQCMNILQYTDIIYKKQQQTTILISQQFETMLQQEIHARQSSKKPFNEEQFNQIVISLFNLLSEMHQRGLHCQDINLQKIVMTEDKKYKFHDFYFALRIKNGDIKSSTNIQQFKQINENQIKKDDQLLVKDEIQQIINIIILIMQFQNSFLLNKQQISNQAILSFLHNYHSKFQNIIASYETKSSFSVLNKILPFLKITIQNQQMLKEIIDKNIQIDFLKKIVSNSAYQNEQQIQLLKLNLFISTQEQSKICKQVRRAYKLILKNQQLDIQSQFQLNLEFLQHLQRYEAFQSSKIIKQLITISFISDQLGLFDKSLLYSQNALHLAVDRYKDNHFTIVNSFIKVSKSYFLMKNYLQSEEAIDMGLLIYSKLSKGYKKVNKCDLYTIIDDLDKQDF